VCLQNLVRISRTFRNRCICDVTQPACGEHDRHDHRQSPGKQTARLQPTRELSRQRPEGWRFLFRRLCAGEAAQVVLLPQVGADFRGSLGVPGQIFLDTDHGFFVEVTVDIRMQFELEVAFRGHLLFHRFQ
jgi:hypothetical protein